MAAGAVVIQKRNGNLVILLIEVDVLRFAVYVVVTGCLA